MPELEEKIGGWRARMSAALRGDETAVAELEAHLRDQIEVMARDGMSDENAFAAAVKQLGDSQEIAREFASLKSRRFPETSWLRVGLLVFALCTIAVLMVPTYAVQGT